MNFELTISDIELIQDALKELNTKVQFENKYNMLTKYKEEELLDMFNHLQYIKARMLAEMEKLYDEKKRKENEKA